MECQCTTASYLLADYSLLDSQSITFTTYNKNKALESQLSGNSDFEKLKKASEGWYIVSQKNKSLYFSDLRFGLLNDNQRTLNLLLAMNLLQLNLN
jgi:inner membrane protein